MEQYLAHSDKFDHGVMDRFLNLSELPVIGTSALEQILHQASLDFPGPAPAPTAASQSPASCSGSAMSPDSSQWTASTSGVESGSEASDSDCLPDSTVADKEDDVCSVNSDPLNSSSSEYSYTASPPSFEPVLHEDSHRLAPAQHSLNDSGCHVTSPQPSLPSLGLGKRKVGELEEAAAPTKKRTRKSKAGPNELCCPLCEYSTRVKEHLASHMNSHTSDRKYMCGQCGQTFKWSHSLRRHQRTHQKDYKFSCSHCPKTFSRKDHLAVHEKLHDSENTESYPCPECGVKFKNKKTLTGHVKTHSTDKPHKCDSCDSAFTRKASLTRHVLAAHAGHVFHCDICSAPFSYKSTLEDHRRAVHNEGKRDFHCLGCGLSFACKSYLQKHLTVCKNRADKEEVPCTECGKLFPTRKQMGEHRRTKHRAGQEGQVQGLGLPPQNMGHNLGQYFSNKTLYKPAPAPAHHNHNQNVLPPFSRQTLAYQEKTLGYQEKLFPAPWGSHAHPHQEAGKVAPAPAELSLAPLEGAAPPPCPAPEENVGSLLRQVYHTEHHHQPAEPAHYHAHKMAGMAEPIYCDYAPVSPFDSYLYYNA